MKKNFLLLSLFLTVSFLEAAAGVEIKISYEMYKGSEGIPYCDNVLEMGDRIWREYPYFYVAEAQKSHTREDRVANYKTSSELLVLVARTQAGKIIAVSFSLPLKDYYDSTCFEASTELVKAIDGKPVDTCFYIAETLVEKEYRHQGVASTFYKMLEEEVRKLGSYRAITRLIEEHPATHPLKPKKIDHRSEQLAKTGYVRTEFLVHYRWASIVDIVDGKEVIEEDVLHPLRLWFKVLS